MEHADVITRKDGASYYTNIDKSNTRDEEFVSQLDNDRRTLNLTEQFHNLSISEEKTNKKSSTTTKSTASSILLRNKNKNSNSSSRKNRESEEKFNERFRSFMQKNLK